jgi:riboflavin synthase
MFTGLVEEVGRVRSLRPAEDAGDAHLGLSADVVLGGTRVGDSILVNGACLTVDEIHDGGLVFYTMPETLRRTAWGTSPMAARSTWSGRWRPGGASAGTSCRVMWTASARCST